MDSTRSSKWLLFGLVCLCSSISLQARAFSAPRITEVFYDAAGSDDGREWIEVTNFADTPLRLETYTLVESGVNHRISEVSGGALGVGQSAVLTSNVAAFSAAYPGFSHPIFKTSFSLSNTGETLVLRSASSTVDSFSYTATLGARGDGNSLHRTPTGTYPGAPTPGRYTLNVPPIPVAEKKQEIGVKKVATTRTLVAEDVPARVASAAPKSAASAAANKEPTYPLVEGVLALAALVALGVASVWYTKSVAVPPVPKETKPDPDEFEVE